MRRKRLAIILLAGIVLCALSVVLFSDANYFAQDRDMPFASSSLAHPAGTDALGRDRLIRVSVALLISLGGAISAAILSTAAAAAVGALAAFGPSMLSAPILLLCDAFLALPWLFLLMMVRSALPLTTSASKSAAVTFFVLAALGWPACARAVHRGAKNLERAEWLLQARAGGLRPLQLARYVLPNLVPLLVPQFLISIPAFVMAEANLGVLGLGIGEPLPSWGGMLFELDNSAMLMRTHWVYLPIVLLIGVLLLLEAISVEV